MTEPERQQFLAALHVGLLAVDRPDGPPLVSPIWYQYSAGGDVEFVIGASSEKSRLLERSGKASLCAQREALPYAYVTVDGPVEVGPEDHATSVAIATRYLGAELGAQYVDGTAGGEELLVRLSTSRWLTTDHAKLSFGGN